MPVKRNMETGEPVEVHSRLERGATRPGEANEDPTRLGRARPRATHDAGSEASASGGGVFSPFEAPTERAVAEPQRKRKGDSRTRLLRPESEGAAARDEDPMADPVSGWLVVVAGPGRGEVCQLGYGSNSLGRAENSRVRIDFGDDGISRDGHATVTYDPRGRKFYLQHGGGKNLTYLGDDPVLMPAVLDAMQEFTIGRTTLRLVPLCGPDFDWRDDGVE